MESEWKELKKKVNLPHLKSIQLGCCALFGADDASCFLIVRGK